jgi:hypothetical protein
MSTLTVTTINTANSTIPLTLSSGNTLAGGIVVDSSSGGVILKANSSSNNLIVKTTEVSISNRLGINNTAPVTSMQIGGNYGVLRTNLSVGNNHNVNCALGNYFVITCNSSAQNVYFTSAPANTVYSMTLRFANGSGGNTISWANTPRWPGATAPTPSTNNDIWVFITDDAGANWRGNLVQRDSR